jgi:hypothetical protein
MDEVLDILIRFMGEVEANFEDLTDQEAQEISEFLLETFQILQEQNKAKKFPPPPEGTVLLWILSGNNPQAFVNYLRTFPGEGFKELAANPTRLAQVIEKYQAQFGQRNLEETPEGLDPTLYPSSNVEAMKYDPKTKKLLVKFHGEKDQPIYQYEGVPSQIFQLLEHGNAFAKTKGRNRWGEWWPMKNPSIGAALNQFIKSGGYPYQRLS